MTKNNKLDHLKSNYIKNSHIQTNHYKLFFYFIILCIAFFGFFYWLDRKPSIENSITFEHVLRFDSVQMKPPNDNQNWLPTQLPDTKKSSQLNYQSIWYKVEFDLNEFEQRAFSGDGQWTIYLLRTFANGAFYLNGNYLGNVGSMIPPVSIHRRPLMFRFHQALLKERNNVVYFHYVNGRDDVFVEPFYLGPVSSFQNFHESRILMKYTLPAIILVMMSVVAIFMLIVFYLRPQDKTYGWYSAFTFAWMVHHGMKLIDNIPLKNQYIWFALSYLSLGLFVSFSAQFVSYFSKLQYRKINLFILGWSIIVGGGLFIIAGFYGSAVNTFSQYVWIPSILLIGLYTFYLLIKAYIANTSKENMFLLLASGLLVAIGIRDYLYDFIGIVPGSTFYLQFGAGFLVIVWGVILIRRFVIAMNLSENLTFELEDRIAAKTKELDHFYSQVNQLEKEKVVVDERQRIMRDMHDGLGGQLVQLLALSKSNPQLKPIQDSLKFALNDLRLIIDSLSIEDGDITTILGMFRFRTEKMINDVGLQYKWKVGHLEDLQNLGPSTILQILRILQEALTNIMKHANATLVSLSASHLKNDCNKNIVIEMSDNGNGYKQIPVEDNTVSKCNKTTLSSGYGLKNMQFRAEKINAQFSVSSTNKGTSIKLILPI